ncbi:hypothetical protein J1N35_037956 [Gossypium stocksii]|uniref:Uncharacterized protein n=1 Tax=Gossypium stocksii TaxID=47602 RepID=A0A9D3UKZ5_9ROSI|nr:hypothetical protein J1N35_037956 [Gossypium stocksii]
MRFKAKIVVDSAIFLVDLRSAYNILDSKLVSMLSLPVGQQQQMRVTIADGRHMFTTSVCKWDTTVASL